MMNTLLFMNIGISEWIILFFPLVLMVYSLIDLTKSQFSEPVNKIIWVIIILFAPLIGALLYLTLGKSQKRSNT
ncbi:Phospholipase_D-nuclease N-terminal [Daejeonella rubra]|uniref:Phospholipase_D-nuclease N-terminal n=1 Tax=Daejeonella rubra TaxID=990371 RepID=A0A1G9R4H2_9SPHI|nr:Phospholipase_D-nuclease N-terminal [Daejeonella rubra]